MAQICKIFMSTLLGVTLLSGDALARNRVSHDPVQQSSIPEGGATLAPFQHVRFCIRYPAECKSDAESKSRIELDPSILELLARINRDVNVAIAPTNKSYDTNLSDGWRLAPSSGDCNDYAVTKRHELVQIGIPARALRLSVVRTSSGVGHLVLVVATTKGDLVMDNLTETIRNWESTNYDWIKIQSARDARFWSEVKPDGAMSRARHLRIAGR
ncbi:transglutaminase-like cysteine peptidase [Bradyrhizobium sp. HKCCYLS3077]|uniref:transglutaminase-like cysteine peptidase n=1 Tax=unclassified Bradyrhizobium TaxID=2631580 RepID=UPI003EB9CB98